MMPTGQARLFGDVLKDDRPFLDEAASRNWSLLRIKNWSKCARRRGTTLLWRCRCRVATVERGTRWLLSARRCEGAEEEHRERTGDETVRSERPQQTQGHESIIRRERISHGANYAERLDSLSSTQRWTKSP